MSEIITIKDKQFEKFIDFQHIQAAIHRIANDINNKLRNENPIFIAVLNGAFMFAGELMKAINIPCEITFVRFSSYQGTSTTNKVKELLGLNEDIKNRTVVIIEDIVDSGNTIFALKQELANYHPKEIQTATLLFKPEALRQKIDLEYIALEIPNDFIVGFGLDYDGYGRNFEDIYKIKE